MSEPAKASNHIREFLRRVRTRWMRLSALRATVRAAAIVAGVLLSALLVARLARAEDWRPLAFVGFAALTLVAMVAALVWAYAPLRRKPTDVQIARLVEEHAPELEDRLATAVDVMEGAEPRTPGLTGLLVADAARRADGVDLDDIVPRRLLRRVGGQAFTGVFAVIALLVVSREPARQALDSAALAFFPERVRLAVSPGDTKVRAGTPLAIEARLVGSRAPAAGQVQFEAGEKWRHAEMTSAGGGAFRFAIDSVSDGFKYRVTVGSLSSPVYSVTVVRPPRVTRIDVDYTFPPGLGLKPRTEKDGGDIYAPAGTAVTLRIHTDRPAASGEMVMGRGSPIALAPESPGVMRAAFTVADDDSYRVAIADSEGVGTRDDTEYFIRTLEDRPPEVRIVQPASDRTVTRLEEVDIEAQADDDYGIDRFELVYSVRGGPEKAVSFDVPKRATSATGRRTLYLEDLDVQPGDFVSYYVRARDVTRGKRSNEARSDIFFLEIKPFEQEFSLAQSQSMAGAGFSGSIDDLITAQKQVVVATWKLDRRAQTANGRPAPEEWDPLESTCRHASLSIL